MRSVKSLARIGSWAQLRNIPAPGTGSADVNVVPGNGNGNGTWNGVVEKGDKPKKKKEKDKDKERKTAFGKRGKSSSSSWEVGALSSTNGDGVDDTTRSGYDVGVGGVGVVTEPSTEASSTPSTIAGTGIGRGLPSHLHHPNNHPQNRRDSGGTLLSVTTATTGSYRSSSGTS